MAAGAEAGPEVQAGMNETCNPMLLTLSAPKWARVPACEVAYYLHLGWRFSHTVEDSGPEQLYGPAFQECWMRREIH